MINYDFICTVCKHTYQDLIKSEDRFNRFDCPVCKAKDSAVRTFITAPQVRTPKTSASFIDRTSAGGGRPDTDGGFTDLKKAADIDLKLLTLNPKSEEYKQLEKEKNIRLNPGKKDK